MPALPRPWLAEQISGETSGSRGSTFHSPVGINHEFGLKRMLGLQGVEGDHEALAV